MASTPDARKIRKLRDEFEEFKRDTKIVLRDVLVLLEKSDVLIKNYPPASLTISDLQRKIRNL